MTVMNHSAEEGKGENKAAEVIARICANVDMTPTDKLVAIAMAMTGENAPTELGAMLGISKTAAYRSANNSWEWCSEILKNSTIPVVGKVGTVGNCSEKPSQESQQRENSELAQGLQSRAPKELPNGNSLTKKDINPFTPLTFENRVRLEKGVLIVSDDFRDFWGPEFGGSENLNLALIQAAAYVQEGSRRPLEAQVSAQLARYARDKRERDSRYQAAASGTSARSFDEIMAGMANKSESVQ